MQAIILAAGNSSRFKPFSSLPHKSYFTLAGKKLIERTFEDLEKAEASEVIVVIKNENDKLNLKKSNLKIRYVIQKEAQGMGDALLQTKNLLDEEFFLLNAYHFDFSIFRDQMRSKKKNKKEIVLLVNENVHDVSRYGVVVIKGDRIVDLTEKPEEINAKIKVVGIYLLNKDLVEKLEKLPNEHYVFEKAIAEYAKENNVTFVKASKETLTLKYPWELFSIAKQILDMQNPSISKKATIAKSAIIEGNVIIEEGAKILERACIKGPCYIGQNVTIGTGALIRDGSIIEKDSVIGAFSEVKNCIIQEGTKAHARLIEDSIIGRNVRIGGNFVTANRRLDRGIVKVLGVETGLSFLGAIIGDNVNLGVNVSTMPGVVIGNNSIIGPGTVVDRDIPDNTRFYIKATEVVQKPINE